MNELTFALPAALCGEGLDRELADAGVPGVQVRVVESTLYLSGVPEASRAKAEEIVAAHTGAPTPEQQAALDAEKRIADARARIIARKGNTWSALTSAEKDAVFADLIVVVGG